MKASRSFVEASRGIAVGADFLPACRTVRNHYGNVGVPTFTLLRWRREGGAELDFAMVDGRMTIVRVRLTEAGAAARDAVLAVDAAKAREAEMVLNRRAGGERRGGARRKKEKR